MALTWTKETAITNSSPTYSWTVEKAYDFFGYLMNDNGHVQYNATSEPYASFFYDILNDAIFMINDYVPSEITICSCTTTASSGLYELPDYGVGVHGLHWVEYNGERITKIFDEHVINAEISDIERKNYYEDTGTPGRYVAEGTRHIRLLPIPNAANTLRIKINTMPNKVDAMSDVMPVLPQLNKAPSYHLAQLTAAQEAMPDDSRPALYRAEFWRMVQRYTMQGRDPIDQPHDPIPNMSIHAPEFTGDDY